MRLFILLYLVSTITFGQSTKLEKAIFKGKTLLSEADTLPELMSTANFFERITRNEKREWLPRYYYAQTLTYSAMKQEGDAKEGVLNKALESVREAQKIDKNAELIALEGYIQMMRLAADPGTRGQTLSPTVFALFQEAIKMDPDNPRALLFLGQMHYGTAQFFGSSTDEACAYIRKAYDIFVNQEEGQSVYPNWGKQSANYSLKGCNNE